MSLILSGTDGLSDVDGTAATPAIRGTDANTGIFFGTDIIGFSEGGVEAARINADSQFVAAAGTAALPVITTTGDLNTGIFFPAADTVAAAVGGAEGMRLTSTGLGIGTSSPGANHALNVANDRKYSAFTGNTGFNAGTLGLVNPSQSSGLFFGWNQSNGGGESNIVYGTGAGASPALQFASYNGTTYTERARIDSSGNFLAGTTSAPYSANTFERSTGSYILSVGSSNNTPDYINFYNQNGVVGSISRNGGSNVSYGTSSDYRLKENVVPMTGALVKIAQLKPVTYTWKVDGTNGQGFIAHELQAIVPDAVVGEKDALNEDGSIKSQGIDTSFLVATLTAAIQEQQALITQLTARITALEGA